MKIMKIKLFLITVLFSTLSWGQIISWNFTSGNTPNVNLPGGTTALSYNTGGTIGTSGCSGNGYSSNFWTVGEYLQIVAPTTGYNITTMTFNIASSGSGPKNFKFQYSSTGTGGAFTDLGTTFISPNGTSSCSAISGDFTAINALDNNANTVIRLVFTGGEADGAPATGNPASGGTFRIDDLVINGSATTSTPTLNVSETSLTAMDYVFGNGPSTPAKTFTVAGSNLAPLDAADRYVYIEPTGSDFEFSLDNSTFYTAGEIIPFPTGDGFSATTVYVRLKAGLPVGTYTDNTTIKYSNAPTPDLVENISLSGEVTAVAATISTGTITGSPFCVTATTGTSVSVPFTSTGTFNAGNVYTAQLSNNAGSFASPVNIGTVTSVANSGTITATIPANTATGTGYRIHVVASNPTTTGANNGTNLTINLASNSIAPTATQTIPIGVNGNTLTVTETSTPNSRVWKYGTTIGSYTTTTTSTGTTFIPNFATANTYYVVCESTFACGIVTSNYVTINVNTPIITITGTPTLFTYAEGQGPSAYQTLNVSGTSLTDNIVINVPNANWELSTNIAFSSPSATITLNKNLTTHIVASTPVYVRLKAGLSQGQYEFPTDTDFVATSTNAVTKTADLDGEVTPPVPFINVEGNIGTFPDISPVTNIPIGTDNTLFAQQTIGNTQTKSFRIQNLGGLQLDITSVTIVGANPLDFTITTPPPSIIAAGATVTFDVTFAPTTFGIRNAIVRIENNSNNISPNFDFNIQGTGNNPEIAVTGNAVNIPDGNTTISTTDNTFIGNANGNPANPTTVSQNFVISNSGNVVLNISGITISGLDASQFSVSPTTTSIAAGATGTITVTFAPTSMGVKNATINIANNDLTDNENLYTFAVQGNAVSYVTCAPGSLGPLQTIAIQDFETPAGTPTWAYTNTGGSVTNGTAYAVVGGSNSIVNKFIGTRSYQLTNGTGTLNFSFNTSTYQDVELSFRLGSFSATTGNGADATIDNVKVSISTDGVTFIDELLIKSDNSNRRWGFGAGGSVSKVYNSILEEFPSGTGDVGISNILLTNLPISNSLYVRIVAINNDDNETWAIDNITLKGKTPSGISEKTWNGSAWSGDGLPPTASQKAIIDGDLTLPYTLALNSTTYDTLEACECQVNASRNLNVGNVSGTTPATLNIQGLLTNNGTINIYNN